MRRVERELEFARYYHVARENPTIDALYYTLDFIDGKVGALIAFVGLQLVGIIFLGGLELTASQDPDRGRLLTNWELFLFGLSTFMAFASSLWALSCIHLIGSHMSWMMRDLGAPSDPKTLETITLRLARVTSGRRRRFLGALYLSVASLLMLAATGILAAIPN